MRVAVGLSGGVDSAVSAFLLKRRGFDVHAVHMINWDKQEEMGSNCPRTVDEADARRVADRLNIPFHTVNFAKEYWNEVFTKMVENYGNGRTVVPDVDCNRMIKFAHLHTWAFEKLGAQAVATGHYASTSRGDFWDTPYTKPVRLMCAKDSLKDQTYFLSTLSQHQLARAMFPLGSLYKTQVKDIAMEQGLHEVANKKESMGICFVGKRRDFESFIDQYVEPRKGEIVNLEGTVIGEHHGVHHFTLGKRVHVQGCHLGYFVSNLDSEANVVTVCEGSQHRCLYATEFLMAHPHYTAENLLKDEDEVRLECRIQRIHPTVQCTVRRCLEGAQVVSRLPLRAVAHGQMCVLYRGRECIGGGEILSVLKTL